VGDFLLAYQWENSVSASANSGWTLLTYYPVYWSTEGMLVAYRFATTNSTSAPFPSAATRNRVYCISGVSKENPIISELDGGFASGPYTIPSISVPGVSTGSGGSVRFNAINASLNYADNAALTMGTGDFTIETWWYPLNFSSHNGYQCLFSKGYTGQGPGGLTLQCTTSTGGFLAVTSNGTALVTSNTEATANAWNHVAVVRRSGVLTLYLNGLSVGSASNSTNFNIAIQLCVGGTGSGNYSTNGCLNDFRIVKGTAVYTGNFSPSTTPLTAISGTSLLTCQSDSAFTDASPNNFAATTGGTPPYPSPRNPRMSLSSPAPRFTLVVGTGGGGNPGMIANQFEGQGFSPTFSQGGGFDASSYGLMFEGGVGPLRNPSGNVWTQRYSTLVVNPVPESGFFSMF
jgi:hypothetical protein